MGKRLLGNVDAYPSYSSIYLSLYPVDDSDEDGDSYEVEIRRDENSLATFLRKVRAMTDIDTPCLKFMDFARDILHQHTGQFYTNQENIAQIIDSYRQDFTPEEDFPGEDNHPDSDFDLSDFFMTESISLKESTLLNGELMPKGTVVNFYHKGKFNGK